MNIINVITKQDQALEGCNNINIFRNSSDINQIPPNSVLKIQINDCLNQVDYGEAMTLFENLCSKCRKGGEIALEIDDAYDLATFFSQGIIGLPQLNSILSSTKCLLDKSEICNILQKNNIVVTSIQKKMHKLSITAVRA